MIKLKSDCIKSSGINKDYPVSQKGKTFRLINPSACKITIFEVDPCLIKDNKEKKCDYLFIIDKKQECLAYFIELKGTGLTDAIHQILNSIDILYKSLHEHKIFARIVGKRVTPNIKSRRARLDEKLKQFGGDLKIASASELQETI